MYRILIVDDDKDTIYILKKQIAPSGFQVNISSNPTEALRNFKPNFYNLVILDIFMLPMDGFELYDELNTIDPQFTIIFMSASAYFQKDKSRFYSKAIFIQKPFRVSKLLEIIDTQLDPPQLT